ncbi:hypothetical protein V1478_012621 [Vespula squamosa]|uniref:Uncharacterized protein n=1 Tax=Vespula squamosa TaxID=30214 RepID=A0ABD2A8I9_VESSQ
MVKRIILLQVTDSSGFVRPTRSCSGSDSIVTENFSSWVENFEGKFTESSFLHRLEKISLETRQISPLHSKYSSQTQIIFDLKRMRQKVKCVKE